MKTKVGHFKGTHIVEGDLNLLGMNEWRIAEEEGLTILQKRKSDKSVETFVIVPLDKFKKHGKKGE